MDGRHHTYGDCGWHYNTFDQEKGQDEYWAEVNDLLAEYQDGWELSRKGEILALGDAGLRELLKTELPQSVDRSNVKARVEGAVLQFRRRGSSVDDRRQAVRDLADVLEFLRPQLRQVITKKDEGDLFNIANNFGIRHHNDRQQSDYDQAIWLSWMFHFYLATIHMPRADWLSALVSQRLEEFWMSSLEALTSRPDYRPFGWAIIQPRSHRIMRLADARVNS